MATDVVSWQDVRHVVLLHAHPDDETLSTGALIVELVARGIEVSLLTATRGERGEVVPGPLAQLASTPELARHREQELATACAVLGIGANYFLGQPPARAQSQPPRDYQDSGMRWVTPTLAGPLADADPAAFTKSQVEIPAADVAAYLHHVNADMLISYDQDGGYGHPDHVHCHHVAATAVKGTDVWFVQIVSPTRRNLASPNQVTWTLPQHLDKVRDALKCHRSQLQVVGDELSHSGGQRQPIETEVVLYSPIRR